MPLLESIPPSPPAPSALKKWWKESSVYQVYPASFCDSNGDGIGDIQGIISKLDHIKNLGADIVWLNPVFASPQVDMGYDISDYYAIYPPYGTLQDLDQLTAEVHARGMKLILDLVVNHTSDQHKWFQASRASTDNEYRDWYIWRKPVFRDGERHPPNNWRSYFGGSAWTYDEETGEYYLHLFAREQPDLNWENPRVREAVHKIVRHWLDHGADGFRMDVINFISKDQSFPDAAFTNPDSPWQSGKEFYAAGPRLHEYLQGIGKILKEYDAFSVGEMLDVEDPTEILKAVGHDRDEINMAFHFEIVNLDHGPTDKFGHREWKLCEFKAIVSKWQQFMHHNNGWNALYLENHDQGRSVSRFASDKPEFRELSAKMLATLLGTQSGTVFIYQGQELGMPNVPQDWPLENYRDIETLNHWKGLTSSHPEDTGIHQRALVEYRLKSRDNSRTPMQWDDSPNAGFSTAEPWIPVHGDYATLNAALQAEDPASVYSYWSMMLGLRKQYADILVYGSFRLVDAENPNVFAFVRSGSATSQKALVLLNFGPHVVRWTLPPKVLSEAAYVTLSNYPARIGTKLTESAPVSLGAFEALLCLS
ncbi:glycoside hydrolase superfamily [Aspergillus sergii]|uniref:Glycoside hydrolase superfamily n=1 Tax=Aspergillus sergii TaxID=1034303 RepID=A0A5N6XDS7_9EURO|nr:glycoside hydrolase superfamily [Aspergillus sergii]